jgi:hypothetical protein
MHSQKHKTQTSHEHVENLNISIGNQSMTMS